MRKLIIVLLLAVVLCPLAAAETPEPEEEFGESYSEIRDELPRSVRDYFDTKSAAGIDFFGSISDTLSDLKDQILLELKMPLELLSGAVGIAVLASVAGIFAFGAAGTAYRFVLNIAVTVSMLGLVLVSLKSFFERSAEAVDLSAGFFRAYVPSLVGVLVSGGKVGMATALTAVSAGISTAVFAAASSLLPGLESGMLCLAAAGTAADGFTSNAARVVKRFVQWLLAAATGAALAIMRLQLSAAAAGDTLGLRTGKYIVGGAVPIVGSTLSDALGAVVSAAAVTKGWLGAVGICALCAYCLPTILLGFGMSLALKLVSFICELLGQKETAMLSEALRSAIDVNTAFLCAFFAVVVMAVGFVVTLGTAI